MYARDGKVCTPTEGPIRANVCTQDRSAATERGSVDRPTQSKWQPTPRLGAKRMWIEIAVLTTAELALACWTREVPRTRDGLGNRVRVDAGASARGSRVRPQRHDRSGNAATARRHDRCLGGVVGEREELKETGLRSTARYCGHRRHRQANSVRVCSPASRRVASLRPRSAGLAALTPAPRTLVQAGSC